MINPRPRKTYKVALYFENDSKLNSGTPTYDDYLTFSHDNIEVGYNDPDFLWLEVSHETLLLTEGYKPDITYDSYRDVCNTFPNIPIIINTTNSIWYSHYVLELEPRIPDFAKNRDIILLHHSLPTIQNNYNKNFYCIHYDLRFDAFRYIKVMGFHYYSHTEYFHHLYKKPHYKSNRQFKFLVINKVKNNSARQDLEKWCYEHSDVTIFSNTNHIYMTNGVIHYDTEPHAYDYYNNQNKNWLDGIIDDPTVQLYNNYDPIKKTITAYQDADSFHRQNKFHWNNHAHSGYYEQSYCSVFVESNETGSPTVSEKTWHALAREHFILPFSSKHLIKLIKSYGFLLPDFIDYSYDDIDDFDQRKQAWLNELNRLNSFSLEHWNNWAKDYREMAMHNLKLFYLTPLQTPIDDYYRMKEQRRQNGIL